MSRRTVLLGSLGIAGVAVSGGALAGCAAQAPAGTVPPGPASSGVPSSATPQIPRWPLTGVPLAAGDDPQHVAVAVKVPDNKREHIHNGMYVQQGINDADIVFVENDGYSSLPSGEAGTRLMPVFHSKYAEAVQAVRSMRPVDAALMAPITGIIGSTGGTGWVLKYMKAFSNFFTPIDFMTAKAAFGGKYIAYDINGKFVYNYTGVRRDKAVFCRPAKLATLAKKFTGGPQINYFPWADEAEASTVNGQPAASVKVPWAKKMNWTMSYKWDEATQSYKRYMPWGPHKLGDGKQVTTENIMVILAPITYGRINSSTGKITEGGGSHPEPVYHVINGTGKFFYAHGGKYVTGTWTKAEINDPWVFTLDDGTPLKMAPGRTFVELPGASSKVAFA
ncbi:MAG: DUF3048 domain-containing protein [Propionibacteriales bacterium]|nr:DUF3048 domain-containing protein [Propionibacteriales bacterium]